MKKYRLKKWVENLLFILEAVIFIALLFIIENNPYMLIFNKLIGAALFILIGTVLLKYTDMED